MPMVRTQAGWVSAGVNVRHNGAWRGAREVWVKENGEWKNALTYKVRVWHARSGEVGGHPPPGETHFPIYRGAIPYDPRIFPFMVISTETAYPSEGWGFTIPPSFNLPDKPFGLTQYCYPGAPWRNMAPVQSQSGEVGITGRGYVTYYYHPIPAQELPDIRNYVQSCPGTHALFYFR